ncbi:MAG TPA: hypothetical protein VHH90_02240 [Polyangia bacterium]|nr:hypothetical protein [Polyangia bacterium]
MRLLIVYTDRVREAENLLAEFGVDDALVLAVAPREHSPSAEVSAILHNYPGAEIVFVGVEKKYRRFCERNFTCTIVHSLESIKGGASSLKAWLCPSTAPPIQILLPSVAFQAAAQNEPRLVVPPDSIVHADRISPRRHHFANKAAAALAEYAAGPSVASGLEAFFKDRHLDFAPNGVRADYTLRRLGRSVSTGHTEWHLKEGDRTTADDAARVYFHRYNAFVIVLRCGPHPSGDSFSIDVDLP